MVVTSKERIALLVGQLAHATNYTTLMLQVVIKMQSRFTEASLYVATPFPDPGVYERCSMLLHANGTGRLKSDQHRQASSLQPDTRTP
jgi:hypothetical protein